MTKKSKAGAHDEDCECCSGGMAAFLEKLESHIAAVGHGVIGTGIEIDGRRVSTSYTVGLSDNGLPELVVFGIPAEIAKQILNRAADRLRAGKLQRNVPLDQIATLPLVFKDVPASLASDYVHVANRRAGREVPAIQMVWPDSAGKFPWDESFDAAMKGIQPTLYQFN